MNLRRQAASDLIRRYGGVFQAAWHRRAEMDAPHRLPHETQFLPAALALQETPVPPAPRVAMWLLIAFATLALVWAVFGRIDMVAIAHGKIVPNDRSKTIQPLETATVKAIHVGDGQTVAAGDVLIELDGTAAQADADRLTGDLAVIRLQVARGQALLDILGGGHAQLIRPDAVGAAAFAEAQRQLDGQAGEYMAKRLRIDAEIARRAAEWRSTHAWVRKLEQTVPIAEQRAQDFKDLADRNLVSRHGYQEQEQTRIEQQADLANQRSRLEEIEAALREARAQRSELTATARRAALDSMADGQQKVAALGQELLKAGARGKLMRLTAPVSGTVQQLAVHTVGGVVTPGQPLMVIVPSGKSLEIEAFVENKDIGFVTAGQDAEVKIETFPYTKYGTLPAQISSVSHDAIDDEKRGLVYSSRVALHRARIEVDGTGVNVTPGMAATVEIKLGTRRVIEYFLSPLLQYAHESLRER